MKAIVVCCLLLALSAYAAGLVVGGSRGGGKPVAVKADTNCVPKQWEGQSASWYPDIGIVALSNISYDASNDKLAFDVLKMETHGDEKPEETRYGMILRFDRKKAYFFDEEQNCTVKDLEHDFKEWCVPDDAIEMALTVGGSLKVNGYRFEIKHSDDDNGAWAYYESTPDNIPITMHYKGTKSPGVTDFYDIVGGIADPAVFEPPSYCDDSIITPWNVHHHNYKMRSATAKRPVDYFYLFHETTGFTD